MHQLEGRCAFREIGEKHKLPGEKAAVQASPMNESRPVPLLPDWVIPAECL